MKWQLNQLALNIQKTYGYIPDCQAFFGEWAWTKYVPAFSIPYCGILAIMFILSIISGSMRINLGKYVFLDNEQPKRKMTEGEKYVYSKHNSFFGAIFFKSYFEKEVYKAIKNGNIVEYEDIKKKDVGQIIFKYNEFDEIIILDAYSCANLLSLEEQKEFVRKQIDIEDKRKGEKL